MISVSCTGVMIPSLDAHLANDLPLRPDIRRMPITELGCVAGAAALNRAHDYLRGHPEGHVLIVAVELPTLSFQHDDVSTAQLVSTALFGDGAAAALLTGRPRGPEPRGARILATRSHLFPDSLDDLGFELRDDGFHVLLAKDLPDKLGAELAGMVDQLLAGADLRRPDLTSFVLHPGGRKILAALEQALHIDRDADAAVLGRAARARQRVQRRRAVRAGSLVAAAPPPGAELTACWGRSVPASPPSCACCNGTEHRPLADAAWRSPSWCCWWAACACSSCASPSGGSGRCARGAWRRCPSRTSPPWWPCTPPLLVAALAEAWLVPRAPIAVVSPLALVVLLGANALRLWVIATLGPHWNVQIMDSAPLGVVTGGPFRFIRHPNYVAVFLELLALPLVHGAWITALGGAACHVWVLAHRIRAEEAALLAHPSYQQLMGGKPRFIPTIAYPRWSGARDRRDVSALTEVVIAGGGVAGSALAILLGRAGRQVELFEQHHFPREKACAEGIMPAGVGVLDRLGLLPAVGRGPAGRHPLPHAATARSRRCSPPARAPRPTAWRSGGSGWTRCCSHTARHTANVTVHEGRGGRGAAAWSTGACAG